MNTDKLEIGDILICKSFSTVGYLIGNALPRSPLPEKNILWHSKYPFRCSSHDAMVGEDRYGKKVFFESLFSGFQPTPIDHYAGLVADNKCELKIIRSKIKLSEKQKRKLNRIADENIGRKYDFRGIVNHGINIVFRNFFHHSISRWWCTESIQEMWKLMLEDSGFLLFENKYPTPYTVEKRLAEGKFELVEEFYR